MAISNFNSPVGLADLANASPAEREALSFSSPQQPFGKRGLAFALAARRREALDKLLGNLSEGNQLRAGLEETNLANERENNILSILGAEPLASRVFDPLSTLATAQRSGGEIPFSGPLDSLGNLERLRGAGAETQKTLGEAANQFNQAGVNVPQGAVLDPTQGVLPELVRERGLSEDAIAAANIGRTTSTSEFVERNPNAVGGLGTRKVQIQSPGGGGGSGAGPTLQSPGVQRSPEGVVTSNIPQDDPIVSQAAQKLIQEALSAYGPDEVQITYRQEPTGQKILTISETNNPNVTFDVEVLPDGSLQRLQ